MVRGEGERCKGRPPVSGARGHSEREKKKKSENYYTDYRGMCLCIGSA